jgi:hypothetical protein
MSRPRFLADHDFNEHLVVGVRRREPALEFSRVRDLGMSDRLNAEILERADRQGLIVVSHDVNTMPAAAYARLAAGKTIAELLMVQQTDPVGIIIENLLLIWSTSEAEEWNNQVYFLPLSWGRGSFPCIDDTLTAGAGGSFWN